LANVLETPDEFTQLTFGIPIDFALGLLLPLFVSDVCFADLQSERKENTENSHALAK